MKIKADKDILLKELAVANKYRGKEGKNNEGKTYISLEANETGLNIKATNGQVYYSNLLPLQVVGEEDLEIAHEVTECGKVALTPKFETVLRKIPSKKVDIEVKNNTIHISADGVNANVSTVENDFPAEPNEKEGGSAIESPKVVFSYLTERTAFAASDKEIRPILKGINMVGDGKIFRVIATDSYRLAKIEIQHSIELKELNVPAKQFASVLDIFNDEDKISLSPLSNYVKLVQNDRVVYIRLLDGSFPNTDKLVNIKNDAVKIKVNRQTIVDSIDRAVTFADEKNKTVFFKIVENGIHVFSKGKEGEIASVVPILEAQGEITENIALNAMFMLDALKAHGTKEVTLVLESVLKPVYIISNEMGHTQMVLPVRTA